MSQCKWCNKKGLFLHLSGHGLCDNCNPLVVNKIIDNVNVFRECIEELSGILIPQVGLKLLEKLKHSLSALEQYEQKGIPTISPPPSEVIQTITYGTFNDSLEKIEARLIIENEKFSRGILTLDSLLLDATLKGNFTYDYKIKSFVQYCESTSDPKRPRWLYFYKITIEFSDDYNSGYYREYYLSNNLRREIPFIKLNYSKYLSANGTEKLYYEDLNSNGEETYTLLEENNYIDDKLCGISKRYSIDGGLIEIKDYDSTSNSNETFYGIERKEFYPETGSLKLEEHKDCGKEYYPNLNLKAEWSNKNFGKFGDYTEYFENGNIKMKCHYLNFIHRGGLMHKYFEDGKIKELWSYNNGKRIFVKKYFSSGSLKTEWLYDGEGKEISKKYYKEDGKEQSN